MLKNNFINNVKHCKHKINKESNEANLNLVKTVTSETVNFKIKFIFRQ